MCVTTTTTFRCAHHTDTLVRCADKACFRKQDRFTTNPKVDCSKCTAQAKWKDEAVSVFSGNRWELPEEPTKASPGKSGSKPNKKRAKKASEELHGDYEEFEDDIVVVGRKRETAEQRGKARWAGQDTYYDRK